MQSFKAVDQAKEAMHAHLLVVCCNFVEFATLEQLTQQAWAVVFQ